MVSSEEGGSVGGRVESWGADGALKVGGESVPHEPGRPDEDGKAERRRREVADACVPNRAGVARRDDATR
jgi:hypothetical protein